MKFFRGHLFDLFGLAGCAAMLFGVAKLSRPAAWIIGGAIVFLWAILRAAAAHRREMERRRGMS